MDISRMKVFIYSLTFLGYAWSGYGSSVLVTLRDAVVAAEHIFGDFLGKAKDVVHKIKDFHDIYDSSIQEECIWKCPGGVKAVKNKFYKPQANGCGPEIMKIKDDALSIPGMTSCCNEHDYCYGTCNRKKEECDEDFKKCLYKLCSALDAEDLSSRGCKTAAKLLYTATTALGCRFYQDAQSAACYCAPSKKKKYPAEEL